MKQLTFTFINSSGNSKNSRLGRHDDLSAIKSHAMRAVRRRKRGDQRKVDETQPSKHGHSPVYTRKSNSIASIAYANRPLLIGLSKAFSGTFDGTAINFNDDLSTNVSQSLYLFVYRFTPSTFPVSHILHQCGIFEIAVKEGDSALVHAICAVGDIHRNVDDGLTNDVGIAPRTHKHYALASLRKRLLSVNASRSNTATLVAITILLIIMETLSGDASVSNIHKSGLAQMTTISRRPGGHQLHSTSITTDPLFADILMADIKSATSSLTQPSTPLTAEMIADLKRLYCLSFVPHHPQISSLSSGFLESELTHHLPHDLQHILRCMRNLVNAIETDFDLGMGSSGVNGFQFLALEHRLLSIATDGNEADSDGVSTALAECTRIALLLYCNLWLWTWPRHSTLVSNLVSRLHQAILQLSKSTVGDTKPHDWDAFVLWLYSLVYFASPSNTITGRRRTILGNIQSISKRLDINTEDDLRSALTRFFYVDRLMKKQMRELVQHIK